MNFKKIIEDAEHLLGGVINTADIVLVANVLGPRGYDNTLQANCSETEHFTVQEFNEIYQGIINGGFFIRKVYFSELEFIKDIVLHPKIYSNTIIMNLCRNGIGMNKKVVIPAICDLLGIKYTSSGSAQCAIARNKWLFSTLLNSKGISSPVTGLSKNELLNKLEESALVICKPNNESASQGVNHNSIMKLLAIPECIDDGLLIQEFIDGYECEVPIFCNRGKCFALPPVGINMGTNTSDNILSYDISKSDDYSFYSLSEILPNEICAEIMQDAIRTFELLGLEKYGRVDFRIARNSNAHYVIDISTTPYITKHSSFAYAVEKNGGSYSDIYKLIIAATLQY